MSTSKERSPAREDKNLSTYKQVLYVLWTQSTTTVFTGPAKGFRTNQIYFIHTFRPYYLQIYFSIIFSLKLKTSIWTRFLVASPWNPSVCFLAGPCYMNFQCHRPRLGHRKETWCGVHITKRLSTKFSPASCFSFLLRSKYYSQCPVL